MVATAAEKPDRQILGLRLGMNREQAHTRLKEIGQFVRNESQKQEVWTVRDPNYSHLLIGLAKDDKLRYVTAVAREDKEAKPVPYQSIGDLKEARVAGDPKIQVYNYQWHLPAEKGEPETLIIAIGRDPDKLSTYSLKRLGAAAEAGEND
jgi:hypothetical protein